METSTHEELCHRQEQTEGSLKEQYQNLDVSIIHETLKREEFKKTYTKSGIAYTSFMSGIMVATVPFLLGIIFGLFITPMISDFVLAGTVVGCGISFGTSKIVSATVMHRKNKQIRTIFGRLYEEYKQKNQFEGESYQDQTCDDMIEQITKTHLELIEQKTRLERKEQSNSSKEADQMQKNIMVNGQCSYENYGKQKCKQF